jgi:hypothetical protein
MPCAYNFPQKGKVFALKDCDSLAFIVGKKWLKPLHILPFTFLKQALIRARVQGALT